jgi:TolA-binding protein
LFVRGNHARRQGDAERATRLYRELDQRFPSSLEASVARLTAALLYLDRGDPAGALRTFHRYLSRPVGGLEAEALVGSATALSRLGRRSEEAATWVRVAHAYPDSAYARQAQQRLRSLRVR